MSVKVNNQLCDNDKRHTFLRDIGTERALLPTPKLAIIAKIGSIFSLPVLAIKMNNDNILF